MAFSLSKSTRDDGWAVPIPWWRDSNGEPNRWCGNRPSWHGMIFFVGAGSAARVALNVLAPTEPAWYIVVYAVCLTVGLVVGRAVRVKADDAFSRMCSGWVGFAGFTATGLVAALAADPPPEDAPAMAGYAPVAASMFLLLLTLGGSLLSRWFPTCVEPSARQLTAEIDELTRRLTEARDRQAALRRPAAPRHRSHDPRVVRAWARSAGLTVPARGRIPASVVDAWRAAGGTGA